MLFRLFKLKASPQTFRKPKIFTLSSWLKISFMVSLIIIGAWITIPIPMSPVPFTLQVAVVLLCPFILGTSGAIMAVLLYLIMGALGFPVFSGLQGGLAMIAGPTGGYLVGFLLAMPLMGIFTRKNVNLSLVLGMLTIYATGVSYLALSLNIGYSKALLIGFAPYIVADILKIVLVRLVLQKYRKSLIMQP